MVSPADMEDMQDPFALFQQLERNLTAASTKMEKLAQEQKNQCETIKDAAEKASQTAIDASEAFAVSKTPPHDLDSPLRGSTGLWRVDSWLLAGAS